MLKLLIAIIVSSMILTACAIPPSRTYEKSTANIKVLEHDTLNIDTIKPIIFTTQANKAWQNTRIFLENGDKVNITASGSWSPAPLLILWSGPEGNTLWSPEVAGIPGSALMAKLGHDGRPFGIGINKTFRAQDYGMLYFAMNDPFNYLFDNTGTVEAEIFIAGNENKISRKELEIISYTYDDHSGDGSLSAKIGNDHFKTRQRMINKIGEIASSKNIAIEAGRERLKGGNYKLNGESTRDGILTIEFTTLW